MIDFGLVRPGTTLYIPFATYDSNDPAASVTLTGLATTDIEVYKNGSVTQRSSDAGYALLDTDGIDFDAVTGIHGFSIDLADNTDAGFYSAGAQYWVVVASITVDAGTVNFIAATFRIGLPQAVLNTTIATLSTQTSFTLTAGPAEDDALNGCAVYIHDVASAVQGGYAIVSDYTGATKTVTLVAGTTFTAAATDNISMFPPDIAYLRLGAPAGASVSADVAAVKSDTAEIGTAGAGLTNINLPNQTMDIVGNITGNLSGSVGGVTGGVTVSTNTDKTGYTLSSAGIQAVWDALTSALTTVGSIGKIVVDNINATISSRASQTSVDDLPTNAELTTALGAADDATLAAIAALNNLSAAQVNAEVDTALSDVGLTTTITGRIDAAVSTRLATAGYTAPLDAAGTRTAIGLTSANLDTQLDALPTAAEINAEVVDALTTDTYAEPGQGAPAATTSLAAKIGYLYKSWRNKKDGDGTTEQLYADNGTTVDQKATTSEAAGIVTKSEVVSGP